MANSPGSTILDNTLYQNEGTAKDSVVNKRKRVQFDKGSCDGESSNEDSYGEEFDSDEEEISVGGKALRVNSPSEEVNEEASFDTILDFFKTNEENLRNRLISSKLKQERTSADNKHLVKENTELVAQLKQSKTLAEYLREENTRMRAQLKQFREERARLYKHYIQRVGNSKS